MKREQPEKRRQHPDSWQIRCRRLGHEVTFFYCRTQEGDSACPLIRDCWWQRFPVDDLLRRILPPEQFRRLQTERDPSHRLSAIMRVLEEVKNRGS